MRRISLFLLLINMTMAITANSQSTVIKLWPKGAPGSIASVGYVETIVRPWGRDCFAQITDPEMLIYLPAKEKTTGTAILVCPGGAYKYVSIINEGYEIASWLNEQGIAAFLLKYRLPADEIMTDKSIGPLQDAQEAMRIIRRNAAQWGIDPAKVGVMGFSAGGHLASTLCTDFNEKVCEGSDSTSARPSFSVLVYPVISMNEGVTHQGSRENLLGLQPDDALVEKFSNDSQVTKETPPAFLVHSSDDGAVPVQNSVSYYLSLKESDIAAELHIYQKGGHGYGLGKEKGTASQWPEACIRWLRENGWL
jgi:acetyl esterase/lipase